MKPVHLHTANSGSDTEVTQEQREHKRLLTLWATGKATKAQMLRCMELDRKGKPYCKVWPNCACILRGKATDCPNRLAV